MSQTKLVKKGFASIELLLVLILVAVVGFGAYYFGTNNPAISPVTSPLESNNDTSSPDADDNENTYTYQNFSFTYPDDWQLMAMQKNDAFPLKARLTFYDEVIAVEKDGMYLIVTIEKGDGTFSVSMLSDEEIMNNFDEVSIGDTEFYLAKEHSSLSALEAAHSGPAMWGSLLEYDSGEYENGNPWDGYTPIIRKGEYSYQFIVLGEKQGETSLKLQSEIIQILESIQW